MAYVFYFFGFWAPVVLPLKPKKHISFVQGLLNSLESARKNGLFGLNRGLLI